MSRPQQIVLSLLAGVLIAGCFLAGYLLMPPETPTPAPPATLAATPPPPATGPRLVITQALYGDLPDGAAADVTAKVAKLLTHDTLTVAATNDNFGDTAPNIVKKLRVDYTFDGIPHTRIVGEDETLKIAPGPPRLVIKKAVYGDLPDGAAADVTTQVAKAADSDSLSIGATNDNFGDTAPNIVKKLRVEYTFDGQAKSKTAGEGETLTISTTGE